MAKILIDVPTTAPDIVSISQADTLSGTQSLAFTSAYGSITIENGSLVISDEAISYAKFSFVTFTTDGIDSEALIIPPLPMFALNATNGADTANSYATIAEADAVLSMAYDTDEWTNLTSTNKAKLLMEASKAIDNMPFLFESADESQAMRFPVYVSEESPNEGFLAAKEATVWQAWWLYRMSDALKEADTYMPMGIRTEQVGPLKSVRVGYNPMSQWSPKALKLLGSYTDFNFIIRRG